MPSAPAKRRRASGAPRPPRTTKAAGGSTGGSRRKAHTAAATDDGGPSKPARSSARAAGAASPTWLARDGVPHRAKDTAQRLSELLQFKIVVSCKNERHQTRLLRRLEADGLSCKALIA